VESVLPTNLGITNHDRCFALALEGIINFSIFVDDVKGRGMYIVWQEDMVKILMDQKFAKWL
jgi:hypothetical protein